MTTETTPTTSNTGAKEPASGPAGASEHLELPIEGMTCASCARRIEKRLNKVDGVAASVNYATERASVDFDPALIDVDGLAAVVAETGYQAVVPAPAGTAAEPEGDEPDPTASLRRRLIVSAALSLPVLALSMIPALQFDFWPWLVLQLATPVVVWGAWPFHKAAWANLRHGTATMDTLISLGTIAAWTWSVVALFFLGAGDPSMRMGFNLSLEPGAGTSEI
ncbi:hypothetical protein BH20ACT1_BH20ACT1_01550 [soil metagenome]